MDDDDATHSVVHLDGVTPTLTAELWNMFNSLIWLWDDFQAAVFWGLIKCKHGEQMPTGEEFSILFFHLCLQTRCSVPVKQTKRQVCLGNKWLTDVGAVRLLERCGQS